jgi:hypothetical protein
LGDSGNGLNFRRDDHHPISIGLDMSVIVTNTNNSGEGSLRQALADVSSSGEILFDLIYPDTIVLDSQLVVDRYLTLTGPETGVLTISGNNMGRVFNINEHLNVNISNLNIIDGNAEEPRSGGGIKVFNSDLTLTNVVLTHNVAGVGGGIYCGEAKVIMNNVTINNNTAFDSGGGIAFYHCNAILTNVTITNNSSAEQGGGIGLAEYNEIIMKNVTIANNSAGTQGGGIRISGGTTLIFDSEQRCNIYSNIASVGSDLRANTDSIIAVVVDTFTVLNPTSSHAYPISAFTFDILTSRVTGINENDQRLPNRFAMTQNYPNPFNPTTIINYELPITNYVDLSIYNLLGQKVTTLVSEKQKAGHHQVEWDASGFASGVYYYRLSTSSGFVQTRKLVLIR